MVKLDKLTGKTVWTSKELGDTAAYSSITVADVGGVRTYMTFTAAAGVGVRASDGKLMFRYPQAANKTANVANPVYSNNKVFFTSAYGTGGGLLELTVHQPSHWQVLGPLLWAEVERAYIMERTGRTHGLQRRHLRLDAFLPEPEGT